MARVGMLAAGILLTMTLVRFLEQERVLGQFTDSALLGVDRADTDRVVVALAHATYQRTASGIDARELSFLDRVETLSFFNMTPAVALRHGCYAIRGRDAYGPCGTMTRIVLNCCWRQGIEARKLHLVPPPGSPEPMHTMLEWRSAGRWQVVAPSDDFVWRNRDGRPATVAEIRADSTIFAQVLRARGHYPLDFRDTRNIRWEKFPAPLRALARSLLGDRGYALAVTPRLYDEPRGLFVIAALIVFLAASAFAWRVART